MTGPRYTSVTPLTDNGCADCAALGSVRAFCNRHAPLGSPACFLCADSGWTVAAGRFGRCGHGRRK
jgi:hypothetical protein